MKEDKINKLATEIHKYHKSKGWWDNGRSIKTSLMLVITEISEATEGERKDLMDDHLPHRKMGEVELADTVIRLLDVGGKLGLVYKECDVHKYKEYFSIYEEHFDLCSYVVDMWDAIENKYTHEAATPYSICISGLFKVAQEMGYNIEEAMYEKLKYNKTRADHEPTNRLKEGGKKV